MNIDNKKEIKNNLKYNKIFKNLMINPKTNFNNKNNLIIFNQTANLDTNIIGSNNSKNNTPKKNILFFDNNKITK